MHFANIGCLFSLGQFLEKKVCGHIASELCLGYSEAKYKASEEQNLKLP